MGGGLSALSRRHGFGVDNVVDIEIVLPNGTVTNADACHNSDLFWALRGGGGGAFGVVTGARYKLHEVQPVRYFGLDIAYEDGESFAATCESFWSKWVDVSPSLSDNWGGYWTLNSLFLYYEGDPTDAQPFIDDMQSWKTSQVHTSPVVHVMSLPQRAVSTDLQMWICAVVLCSFVRSVAGIQ